MAKYLSVICVVIASVAIFIMCDHIDDKDDIDDKKDTAEETPILYCMSGTSDMTQCDKVVSEAICIQGREGEIVDSCPTDASDNYIGSCTLTYSGGQSAVTYFYSSQDYNTPEHICDTMLGGTWEAADHSDDNNGDNGNTNGTGGSGGSATGCCRISVPLNTNSGTTYEGPADDIETIEEDCTGTYISWTDNACTTTGSYGSCTAIANGITVTVQYYDQAQAGIAKLLCTGATGTWED